MELLSSVKYNIKDPESCTVWYYGYGIVWQISMLVYSYRIAENKRFIEKQVIAKI